MIKSKTNKRTTNWTRNSFQFESERQRNALLHFNSIITFNIQEKRAWISANLPHLFKSNNDKRLRSWNSFIFCIVFAFFSLLLAQNKEHKTQIKAKPKSISPIRLFALFHSAWKCVEIEKYLFDICKQIHGRMVCVYYCCYLLKNNNKSKRISNSILFSVELAQLELHFILNCFVYLCHCLFIVYFRASSTMILLQMKHHLSRFSSCSLFGRCFSFSHLLILIINDTIFYPRTHNSYCDTISLYF